MKANMERQLACDPCFPETKSCWYEGSVHLRGKRCVYIASEFCNCLVGLLFISHFTDGERERPGRFVHPVICSVMYSFLGGCVVG